MSAEAALPRYTISLDVGPEIVGFSIFTDGGSPVANHGSGFAGLEMTLETIASIIGDDVQHRSRTLDRGGLDREVMPCDDDAEPGRAAPETPASIKSMPKGATELLAAAARMLEHYRDGGRPAAKLAADIRCHLAAENDHHSEIVAHPEPKEPKRRAEWPEVTP